MSMDRWRDAHTVLLPAIEYLFLCEHVERYLANGGCSILLGETREEYVARAMSTERKASETKDSFVRITRRVKELAGDAIIAVDQEIGGIDRLHSLVPQFFSADEWRTADLDAIESEAARLAESAKALGVNCFLAPILDVVTGENPWLHGRTISADPDVVGEVSSAFIRGVQSVGVAATAKHFPGHHHIPLDPAVNATALVHGDSAAYVPGFAPFSDPIRNGVELVMIGPAIVDAFDSDRPAGLSNAITTLLRNRFQFTGLVMSDGLEAPATRKNSSIPDVAIEALRAGCDLLLLSAGPQLEEVASAICNAVARGTLPDHRLSEAASRVRALAAKYRSYSSRVQPRRTGKDARRV